MSAFRGLGVYTVDASKAGTKVAPSKVFCEPSQDVEALSCSGSLGSSDECGNEVKFAECLTEGYDLVDDLLYITWRSLKSAVISECSKNSTNTASNPIPQFNLLSISSAFKEVLTLPKPAERVAAKMPSHLSSAEVIRVPRKVEREERRRQREKEKEIRATRGRGQRNWGRGKGRGKGSGSGQRGGGTIGRGIGGARRRGNSYDQPESEPSTSASSSNDASSSENNGDPDVRGNGQGRGNRIG